MRRRTNTEWLCELHARNAEALADLREYLLRVVFLYLDRHREDLIYLDRRELEHLAEDFAQEALLQIQDRLDTFRGESKFTTWAYRFVINIAAAELRRRCWRTVSLEEVIAPGEEPLLAFLGDQEAADPETIAQRRQILEVIGRIIQEDLTENQRFAVVNVYFRGMPMVEVAEQLGTTRNNVYKLLHDARKKLRRRLRDHFYSKAVILSIFGER